MNSHHPYIVVLADKNFKPLFGHTVKEKKCFDKLVFQRCYRRSFASNSMVLYWKPHYGVHESDQEQLNQVHPYSAQGYICLYFSTVSSDNKLEQGDCLGPVLHLHVSLINLSTHGCSLTYIFHTAFQAYRATNTCKRGVNRCAAGIQRWSRSKLGEGK